MHVLAVLLPVYYPLIIFSLVSLIFHHTVYCFTYPDIRSPKIHSSPSARLLREERCERH